MIMPKNRKLSSVHALVALALIQGALAAHSAPIVDADIPAATLDRANEAFDEVAAKYPALNATVRRQGRIVWEREGGKQRDERDGVERKYNFYSTAKMLTGLAYARLEEQGLNLDTSVRSIDRSLPMTYDGVTLRMLLTHTSGVRHYKEGGEDWKTFGAMRCAVPADAIQYFVGDPLSFQPGQKLQYSSYGFVLLSHLLVKQTGAATYDEAMRRVLGNAYTEVRDSEGVDKAVAYEQDGEDFRPLPKLSAECKFGAGGLLANSRELALTGEALYQGMIVDLAKANSIFRPAGEKNPFSHGTVVRREGSTLVLGHSGGSPGGRGYLEVWMEPKVSVAITGNFEGPGLGGLAAKLGSLFAALQAEQPTESNSERGR